MNSWLLPDGINESLPDEAEKLEQLRRLLIDKYATWGYRLVMPPLVEYMESLRAGMGTLLDLQTFKITDQLNGRMMGVRADITPQVARIDAHRMAKGDLNAASNRLCYIGSVLRTRSAWQGGSRSPVQVGAELFGHAGLESDLEIVSLMLETLHLVGVDDFVLDLGHVGVANGLSKHIGLSQSQQETYFDMLTRKSIPEIKDWIGQSDISDEEGDLLRVLPTLSGSVEVITEAGSALKGAGQAVTEALDYLERLCDLLTTRFPSLDLHIDLAELRGYSYHTGIVYAAYLPGRGHSLARGGRYDGIGESFSNARPATGFSTDLRTLASFYQPQTSRPGAILAPFDFDPALDELVSRLRAQGERVIRLLDKTANLTAGVQGCDREIIKQDDGWVVVSFNQ